ncbi:MAG: hypothetical protein A3J46_01850 [Candidatus Yanofskybacteria bacterium RIFCSPHIGHO2_02_FULL_41_11]|uniref:DAHP synthetase I/KDSA domain-containing protein n=1 Tax=Candidatus Yanofskybacteria bacterium RIFCSPHIGHO2_02_FULL_41_11 TaxID=1802675 RepID=A0A1F8F7E3_9BACT|nr:MAG: hypothetical protein UY21_C0001G0009 [Microgenomates group bacterium GW2011_GWA1_48_10]OGN08490.1 MAG: hypothetical protein A3J46_01850 [Candidatus Yanofskybacteria bacterium RIFCSPHIGHO2_02_FULL_41_11]
MINLERPILIGGPCAAESAEQVNKTAFDARVRGFGIFRASLEKPRTSPWEIVNGERRPCFLGVGVETGAPWLVEASKRNNIVPATEVMSGGQLLTYLEVASGAGLKNVCAWLGSRRITDQNFLQEIGGIARENPTLILGLKNPTAKDERTWLGVIGWTIHGGADPRQMFTVHRGFPDDSQNLFRNPPDWDMMIRVAEKSGLPMIVDPSHIGGGRQKVIEVVNSVIDTQVPLDGFMVEIHPNPRIALTDANQQLSWQDYDSTLKEKIDQWQRTYRQK